MKSLTIVQILLFIILMIAYTCSSAQDSTIPNDYVVTTTGDTLKGTLKLMNYGAERKVQVTDASKKKTTVSLFKTRMFLYNNEIYHPVKGEKGYVYMKLKKEGYLSLYAFQLENQATYDGLYLVRRDGKNTEVPNLSFKKIMAKYLSDCKPVTSKIEDGTYGRKELNLIIDDYNQCIEKKYAEMTNKAVVQTPVTPSAKETPSWNALEEKVKSHEAFEGQANALEMISEIKNKIQRGEKIPNFLTEGLKSALAQTDLKEDLDKALAELN